VVPVVVGFSWWATAGEPSQVVRRTPGGEDCATSDLLGVLPRVHHNHRSPEGGDLDRAAGAVLVAAARCERVEELPIDDLFATYLASTHGVAWLVRAEAPADAVADLLDVWELAADQRGVGPLVSLGTWTAVGLQVSEALEPLLDDPRLSASDRAVATARLRALAVAPLDWDEVAAREERATWGMLAQTLTHPAWWPELLGAPRYLWQARHLSHPIVADLRDDVAREQAAARSLAGG
jgi:hypothetical protein